MEPTTNTIAYTLRVPAENPASMADALVRRVQRAQESGTPITLTGSHVAAREGAVRFRIASDEQAIAFATRTGLCPDGSGATLHSGFGVHQRLVAEA